MNKTMQISTREFIIIIAFLMSIVAISVDALLPALGYIAKEIPFSHPNEGQYIISALFLGMAMGQLICGPLSDATGRRKVLFSGIFLFLVGSTICYFANGIPALLFGRWVQGLGVSAPYISAFSVVRDRFEGREMAKIMSIVMMIFILVPALAPSLGQMILLLFSWRSIFLMYILYSILIGIWIFIRLKETLPEEKRIPFQAANIIDGFREVLSNRITMTYTICMGLFFGSFFGYLNSSQQIFQVQFETGKLFTVYFGGLALLFGIASLLNSQLVEKWGMHYITKRATIGIIISSFLFLSLQSFVSIGLWMFLPYVAILFFCFGLLFGNFNSLAMEPMGHIAGIASAIIGSVSSILSMIIGTTIGQLYDQTVMPVTIGFLVMSCLSAILTRIFDPKFRSS
ncbi:Bcr/CflA family efflux MFS transporter [Leptospira ognonensis]|uniref:Bcr/CflA family efflux MFS transporter n=1 Tax=Leptospira ognonensis TaxID=2484945 RepID=A0A4R9K0H9_9LEPT|nr:multidrug effflux MFS transporter [Leptospira ognonensis]TGL58202.1 Bcr/CflA family efflux MFS transporter [Leptospira ognonensis]